MVGEWGCNWMFLAYWFFIFFFNMEDAALVKFSDVSSTPAIPLEWRFSPLVFDVFISIGLAFDRIFELTSCHHKLDG